MDLQARSAFERIQLGFDAIRLNSISTPAGTRATRSLQEKTSILRVLQTFAILRKSNQESIERVMLSRWQKMPETLG